MSDLYRTLGVRWGAPKDELKSAHRKLAKKFHPDSNPGDKKAEARFKEIQEAYEILNDPEKCAKYERGELPNHKPPPIIEAPLSVADFMKGVDYPVSTYSCKQSVEAVVRLARGSRPGMVLAVPDYELYIRLTLVPRQTFSIQGDDLHASIALLKHQLESGIKVRLQLPHGIRTLEIPAGKVEGDTLTFPNLGLPIGDDGKFGNLVLTLKIKEEPASEETARQPNDDTDLEFNARNFPNWTRIIKALTGDQS
jgi:curved DNA-binding protein